MIARLVPAIVAALLPAATLACQWTPTPAMEFQSLSEAGAAFTVVRGQFVPDDPTAEPSGDEPTVVPGVLTGVELGAGGRTAPYQQRVDFHLPTGGSLWYQFPLPEAVAFVVDGPDGPAIFTRPCGGGYLYANPDTLAELAAVMARTPLPKDAPVD